MQIKIKRATGSLSTLSKVLLLSALLWNGAAAHAGVTNNTNQQNTDSNAPSTPKDCNATGCPIASVVLTSVSLRIQDNPVGYQPPLGPEVKFRVVYNEFDSSQSAAPQYFNLGPHWTTDWLAYIIDNPGSIGNGVSIVEAGGGNASYSGFTGSSAGGTFTQEERTGAILKLVSFSPVKYERDLPDGSKEIYSQSNGATSGTRRVFLTQTIDARGNALSFAYDASMRLVSVTDAIGQVTTLQYTNADNPLLITGVTDPFGRTASIGYDASGQLISLTDAIGMQSTFTYGSAVGVSGNVITSMTTPYGTSSFATWQDPSVSTHRWITTTDPLGHVSKVETMNNAPIIPFSEAQVPSGMSSTFNSYINSRNTFVWDAVAYAAAPNDYSKALIYHWYHEPDGTTTSGSLESLKPALENRIWYNYPNQPSVISRGTLMKPTYIGRVLPDGSTQLTRYTYNSAGNPLTYIDPVGRTTTYTYATNGIDLVSTQQANGSAQDVLSSATYNSQHLPLTLKDAGGKVTTLTYNSAGQPLTVQDPLGEVYTLGYNDKGYLTTVTAPNGKVVETRSYDAVGRLASRTDSEGYTASYQYDNLDRVTQETYPDGTHVRYVWDKLDLASVTDRQGHTTTYTHDAARNLTSVTDALGHTVSYGYDDANRLISLTDGKGNTTTWTRDIQGRITSKTYPDSAKYTYAYDSVGRLSSVADPKGQVKNYAYTTDDKLKQLAYGNAQYPTPSVSLAWDSHYPRVMQMTDGLGTHQYQYVPAGTAGAGKLQQDSGPFAGQANGSNDILTMQYDALGRLSQQSLGSTAETYVYDVLGRITQHGNAMGSFNYAYLGQTEQVTQMALAGKSLKATYSYANNLNDRSLTKIAFNNGYTIGYQTVLGLIQSRTESGLTGLSYTYDAANRLTKVGTKCSSSDDESDDDSSDSSSACSSDDESDDESSSSVVGNQPEQYVYDAADNLIGRAGKQRSWTALVDDANKLDAFAGRIVKTDANGNVIDDGMRQYTWDAEDRLIEIRYSQAYLGAAPVRYTRFQYDGQGRRTVEQTVSLADNTVQSELRYRWCGNQICAQSNNQNQILKRYFAEGELNGATSYYYGKDQLGSIVQVLNASGSKLGQDVYSAYGETDLAKNTQTEFGYADMQRHTTSSLYLTQYRVYDPESGRWLSRDPMQEQGGLNLYAYVGGNPINLNDPLGLCISQAMADGISGAAGGFVGGYVGSGGNLAVAAASGVIGGVGNYLASGSLNGSVAAGAAGGLSGAVKGGGGVPGMIGGAIAGAMGNGLGGTAQGALPNASGGVLGGFVGGLVGGTIGNPGRSIAPLSGGVMGALGGLAGGLTQDLVNELLKSQVCQCNK